MTDIKRALPPGYCGSILRGNYSAALKIHVADCIQRYADFEETGCPALLYIAAWREMENAIWYEYASKRFMDMLGCHRRDLAAVFRKSVIDRRIYRYTDTCGNVQSEVRTRKELSHTWEQLRREGKSAGTIEAVYKVALPGGGSVWLKDMATITTHPSDNICLSLGMLAAISKEMEIEHELMRHGARLEGILAQRTAELTHLNEELRQSYYRLQRNLDDIVWVMSQTVEERDPYTAGHQRRTTGLALAIAREMKLSDDEIRGLQMAGLVHDIGKISIPAEILSKPGRLNEVELQLIRRHPQAAYEILKKIDFKWPVDLIVLQHHERIDRSGYPQGLSGEETLVEARILCVADVVESMASHRPYRPALGIKKALQEISRNRGLLYDAEVVDACLRAINKKRLAGSIESRLSAIFNQEMV
jgi:HD-GYP domain-containing protein (c-di-GMP phosphodiesterase class II)